MPRGVRRERNIPDEIATLNAQITKHETAIKNLKAQLNSLHDELEQTELKNLNKLLKESGMTTQDLQKIIVKPKEDIA